MKLLFISIFFVLLFLFTETVKRVFKLKNEVTRKLVHIASGVAISFIPYYLDINEGIMLTILFAIFLLFTKHFNLFSSVHAVERHTLGEVYFPLSVGISAFLFLPHSIQVFQFGVLVLALSDGFAGLIGSAFGKHTIKVFESKKSYEGSAVFFLLTFILFLFFLVPSVTIPIIFIVIVGSLFLTILELFLIYGLDNLFLPLVSSFILKIILSGM